METQKGGHWAHNLDRKMGLPMDPQKVGLTDYRKDWSMAQKKDLQRVKCLAAQWVLTKV